MRIISKYKDYYDVIQGYGQDQSLVYLRMPEELEENWDLPYICGSSRWDRCSLTTESATIGFCGKLYPTFRVTYTPIDSWRGGSATAIGHTVEDMDKFVEKHCVEKEIENWYKKEYRYRCRSYWVWSRESFIRSFELFKQKENAFQQRFVEHHCPVFIWAYSKLKQKNVITINGCLKDWDFFRIFDPYLAFQEIQMFLGGIAEPQKKVPTPSDKDMVSIKGFDEWSFRKLPKKKRR